MMFYLDASSIAPLFVADDHSQAMQAWASSEPRTFVVSDFAAAEFAAVVGRAHRTGKLTIRQALEAFADFDQWRSRWVVARATNVADGKRCEGLVRNLDLKLSAADAFHLAIAMEDRLTLVTFDGRLADAGRAMGQSVLFLGRSN
jgi:predicted nucleic acid-binding protein